ncbi:uncharacterized protein LOC115624343 [Scaptodrosophila lebanonensis]|uniref:Uncharacterized protein LOC115624343 n=1 Tax=Drosophila lebanonensis TaxID=7225 RepID=A0A6J2TIE0_DROLE|nr:uncharacterized protein LOC115624343 [Scaptodrosophila lebanonensis]XP_030374868.1 uncharacterized protein LOC115624343 [Scaptodrosophila lebanonensis]XP_030374875.1 uncharacterized protein LOC115624343 [Scaptodrosophila lebanonensis]XP_030374883.1 uncharacterized protein LOC115624343 [Scaptodrosophila lebanonensis]
MEQTKSYLLDKYQGLCNYMERDTIGTELTIYGTSTLMLLIAYAKRKPAYLVRQFKQPSHIPERIINERVMHTGKIQGVQQRDQDTLLMIKHRPLIPIFTSRKRLLPVKLPGVRVNANGFSWLQQCLIGREATFIPLNKSSTQDYVVCQLCLVHPPKGNRLLDVSETLLKLRFAKYAQDVAASLKRNDKYYKHLRQVESSTATKEAWLAWAARYPFIWQRLNELKASLLPKQKLLPELVR